MTDDLVVVDVGKSGARLWATIDGEPRSATSDRGISPVAPGDHGVLLAETLTDLLDAAAVPADVTGIVVGATCDLTATEKSSFESGVRRRAASATLVLSDDGVLAHARALGMPGILLSVGTGVIAVAMSPGGDVARADGWGPLLGDRGSAVEVGLGGLRQAVRDQETGRDTPLLNAARRRYGAIDLSFARGMLADDAWPRFVASFAEDVGLAATQGSAEARALLEDAAAAIVETALVLRDRCDVTRVAIAGRFGQSRPFDGILETALTRAGLDVAERRDSAPDLAAFDGGPYRGVVSLWRPNGSAA